MGPRFSYGSRLADITRATERPLAEPPIFDYEALLKEFRIGTDAHLKRLFGKHIAVGYKWRDRETEERLSRTYHGWVVDMLDVETDFKRQKFYMALSDDLSDDLEEGTPSSSLLKESIQAGIVSRLTLWEYRNLDEDGETTELRRRLNKREDVFEFRFSDHRHWVDAKAPILAKYGALAPPGYLETLKKNFLADGHNTGLVRLVEVCEEIKHYFGPPPSSKPDVSFPHRPRTDQPPLPRSPSPEPLAASSPQQETVGTYNTLATVTERDPELEQAILAAKQAREEGGHNAGGRPQQKQQKSECGAM